MARRVTRSGAAAAAVEEPQEEEGNAARDLQACASAFPPVLAKRLKKTLTRAEEAYASAGTHAACRLVTQHLPELSLVAMMWTSSGMRSAAQVEWNERKSSTDNSIKSYLTNLPGHVCDGCGAVHSAATSTIIFDRVGVPGTSARVSVCRHVNNTGNPLCRLRYKTEAAKLYRFGAVKDALDSLQAIDTMSRTNPHHRSAAPSTLINDAMGALLGKQWGACGRRLARMSNEDLVMERAELCCTLRMYRGVVEAMKAEYEALPSTIARREEAAAKKAAAAEEAAAKKAATAAKCKAGLVDALAGASSEAELAKRTGADLKAMCKMAEVSPNGTKAKMASRIWKFIEENGWLPSSSSGAPPAPAAAAAAAAPPPPARAAPPQKKRKTTTSWREQEEESREAQEKRCVEEADRRLEEWKQGLMAWNAVDGWVILYPEGVKLRQERVSAARTTNKCACGATPSPSCENGGCKNCCAAFQLKHPKCTCKRHG